MEEEVREGIATAITSYETLLAPVVSFMYLGRFLSAFGQRLASGGAQPTEGVTYMGATIQGVGKGGCGCPNLGKNLHCGVTGCTYVWVRDVFDDTTHWEGVERILPQYVPQDDGAAFLEGEGR